MGCIFSVAILVFWLVLVGLLGFIIPYVWILLPFVVIIWVVMTLRKSGDRNAKLQQKLTVEQTKVIVDALKKDQGSA